MTFSLQRWSPWRRRSLLLTAGVWTAIAVLSAGNTVASRARSGVALEIGESLVDAGLACAVFAILTPFALSAGQRWPVRIDGMAQALVRHAALAVVYCLASAMITAGAATLLGDAQPLAIGDVLATSTFGALVAYAATVGVAQFVDTALDLRNQERQRAALAVELSQAQLHALTGQLRPHFLFNALNAISTLIRRDAAAAERLVLDLGRLLRMSLDRTDQPEITLKEEIEFVRAYLSVMSARIGERLHVECDVPTELSAARVPQLLVLPLVENALKHGITRDVEAGELVVAAARSGDRLRITVTDDGPGPPSDFVEGFGIAATRNRLFHHFGTDHEFRLTLRVPHGAVATVVLPLRTA
jgi:two-component system, LytTR family, sensor kinase